MLQVSRSKSVSTQYMESGRARKCRRPKLMVACMEVSLRGSLACEIACSRILCRLWFLGFSDAIPWQHTGRRCELSTRRGKLMMVAIRVALTQHIEFGASVQDEAGVRLYRCMHRERPGLLDLAPRTLIGYSSSALMTG